MPEPALLPPSKEVSPAAVQHVEAIAQEFDRQRSCWWNFCHLKSDCDAPDLGAREVSEYASLGGQCWGTLQELALLHTLRPCKDCGGDFLYKSGFQIGCCSCLGEWDDCDECEESCGNCAENMNLPDAITRWNLCYGDKGERGRVQVIG